MAKLVRRYSLMNVNDVMCKHIQYRFESCPDHKNKNNMEIAVIVGFVILLLSITIPQFIKNEELRIQVGVSLASLATGIFLVLLLIQLNAN